MSGHLRLRPGTRDAFLETCRAVVEQGRAAPGALDFSLSADLLDPDRVDVLEVWRTEADLAAFRGAGIGEEQGSTIVEVDVREHEVVPR